MIILDTNVLSGLCAPIPTGAPWIGWPASPLQLLTTAITRGELLYGVLLLPQGQRKHGLLAAVQAILDIDMAGRVLEFDNGAADAYA